MQAIKKKLKQFPSIVRVNKAVKGAIHGFDSEILGKFPIFEPWSAGDPKAIEALTILSVQQTFPFLAELLSKVGKDTLSLVSADDFCADRHSRNTALELGQLLNKYGSDKAVEHGYHLVYGPILNQRESITALLEIGLGSNNADVVSNMGSHGKPGASLRAFRDFLPKATIYGADVDPRILFQEQRIRTFFVDQTNLESFEWLGEKIPRNLDLIIDDGLHSPNANIAVLIFGLKSVKIGGWVVIEDIRKIALPLWKVVGALIPSEYKPHLIEAKNGAIVFAVQRLA